MRRLVRTAVGVLACVLILLPVASEACLLRCEHAERMERTAGAHESRPPAAVRISNGGTPAVPLGPMPHPCGLAHRPVHAVVDGAAAVAPPVSPVAVTAMAAAIVWLPTGLPPGPPYHLLPEPLSEPPPRSRPVPLRI